ncbi:MAG: Na+/H+ antiporter subunit E [Bdellovibrionaceae bacterium]|nr:Na+/H+ antiporter subunit E [Bdellovibrionales bacterium]MCB9255050.1 Na+/H+ antiporter subunit E [Pseudobdellovibrionaceae bacterium]
MSLRKTIRKTAVLFSFFCFYFYELTASAIRIAWDVVTRKDYSKPGVIDVPLDAVTDVEIALIANLVTFSPGSMVVGLSEDRKTMRVHVMFLDDPKAEIQTIKAKLEARVLEVLR